MISSSPTDARSAESESIKIPESTSGDYVGFRSCLRSRLTRTAWAARGCAESSVNFGADDCLRMSGPPRDQVDDFFPRGHTGKHRKLCLLVLNIISNANTSCVYLTVNSRLPVSFRLANSKTEKKKYICTRFDMNV